MAWLFREAHHSRLYKQFRPSYPTELYEIIFLYLKKKSGTEKWEKCIDIGCGTGISTLPLSSHFKEVVGIDSSESQLSEAAKYCQEFPNILFKNVETHHLDFAKDNSVDLITAAQSLHWFNIPKISKELQRILKPDGIFSAYGYGMFFLDNKHANHIIHKELYKDLLHSSWDEGRRHIDDLYSEIFHKLKQYFIDVERNDTLSIECEYTLDEYMGYVSTWSGYQKYLQLHKHQPEPLIEISLRLKKIYGNEKIKAKAPLFILIAK